MLINLEALPGRRPQSDWKLVKVALLPGKTQLYNLAWTLAKRRMWPNGTLRSFGERRACALVEA